MGYIRMSIPPVSAFTVGANGKPPIVPIKDELAIDEDGSLGVMRIENGRPIFKSQAQELQKYVDNLNNRGVFDNALAGALSRDITYFTYNNAQRSIKINPALSYQNDIRYYAIRNGENYITGRADNTGKVLTVLVDMKTNIKPPYGEGYVSKPEMAMILPGITLTESTYTIEFYDSSKTLIMKDVLFGESTKILSADLTPDVGIVDVLVTTTRPYKGITNACFLYQDEIVTQLGYRVSVLYNDGTSRDVTAEERVGGRLVINGFKTINTANVTNEGDTPQKFRVSYFAADVTGNVGNQSIDKDISVYIKADKASIILKLIPVYWVGNDDLTKINRNHFALFSGGRVENIDARIKNATQITNVADVEQSVSVDIVTGSSNQSIAHSVYGVKFTGNDANFAEVSNDSTSFKNEYCKINFNIAGGKGTLVPSSIANPTQSIITDNTVTDSGIIIAPTNFRIRNIEGTHYYVGGVGVSIASYQNFDIQEGAYPITADKPVLVEYLKVETGASGNMISTITSVRAAYVTITNS